MGFVPEEYKGPLNEAGVPGEGTELLSVHSDGSELWFSGGGAASGPDAPKEGSVPGPPVAVVTTRRHPSSNRCRSKLRCSVPKTAWWMCAPTPGDPEAWVADQPLSQRGSSTAKAKVALIGAGGATTLDTLPISGPGRGSAPR